MDTHSYIYTAFAMFIIAVLAVILFLSWRETTPSPAPLPAPIPDTIAISELEVRQVAPDDLALRFSVSGFNGVKLVHAHLTHFTDNGAIASTSLRVNGESNGFNFSPLPESGNYIISVATDDGTATDSAIVCMEPHPSTCTTDQNEADLPESTI